MALTLNWFVQANLSSLFVLCILHARRFLLWDEFLLFSVSRDAFFSNTIRGTDIQITLQRQIFGKWILLLRRAENASLQWTSTSPNAIGISVIRYEVSWSDMLTSHSKWRCFLFFWLGYKIFQTRQKIEGLSQYKINEYTEAAAVFLFGSIFRESNVWKGICLQYISITTQVHFILEMHCTKVKRWMLFWLEVKWLRVHKYLQRGPTL